MSQSPSAPTDELREAVQSQCDGDSQHQTGGVSVSLDCWAEQTHTKDGYGQPAQKLRRHTLAISTFWHFDLLILLAEYHRLRRGGFEGQVSMGGCHEGAGR